MYNIEELEAKTCDELRAIAKDMEIVGRSRMTKAELVNAIIGNQPAEDEQQKQEVAVVAEEKQEDKPVEEKASREVDEFRKENHRKIVESCEVGDYVAFTVCGSKARSAKVARKSSKRQKLEVETAYGKKFIINYDDVIWVKKTADAKWPHGVYKALKGIE